MTNMACHKQGDEGGYEDERFQNTVSKNLHCVICLNVFKDPVMCEHNQHSFCRSCIIRHLNNSQTCPTCIDQLTVDTLKPAPRVLRDWLSELVIRCDYSSRGCQEFIQLEHLQTHINSCGFAPVVCSNEGCFLEINKRDRIHHESETCEFRKLKCHQCVELKKDVTTLVQKLDGMETRMKINFAAVNEDMKQMKTNEAAVATGMYELRTNQTVANDELREVKMNLTAVENEMKEMKTNQGAVNDEIKVNLTVIKDQLSVLMDHMTQHIAQSVEREYNIIVAGGYGADGRPLSSVENFWWSKQSWELLQPMKENRDEASSFVFKNQMIVTGGGCTGGMEGLDINPVKDSVAWLVFPAKLPSVLSGQSVVVCNKRLIVIGGRDGDNFSDCIYEVLLVPPYTSRLLTRMAEARCYHGAVLTDGKIWICGGRKSEYYCDTVDSVLMYDVASNECREMAPLAYAVSDMGTVKWGKNIMVIGGTGKDGQMLNSVFLYSVKTGDSYLLPEMKCARDGCTSVVVKNTVVVIGGQDEKENSLKSVEAFSFDSYSWENLPSINIERSGATAITL